MKKTDTQNTRTVYVDDKVTPHDAGDKPPDVVPPNVLKLAEEICQRRQPRLYFRSLKASKDSIKNI